ncbi:hypothetical protein TELCIR_00485 [Teladorsagia circumcincta]|uniref:Arrestin C-terminal-like domain-containing protein n=1 Tax=Teladorsagia circumcincta TaxID=45464 RepID=A0A2G9V4N4_TELCI|nr:hypothetical protein TELCIR_00485 [Teladorsagia circumcincta]
MQPSTTKESLGIVVAYRVKIRAAIAGPLGGELVAELPFTLTHAKPAETPERRERPIASRPSQGDTGPDPLDIDLIQLNEEINDLRMDDDDLIFEDFTRLRLKGADSTDEASPSVQSPSSSKLLNVIDCINIEEYRVPEWCKHLDISRLARTLLPFKERKLTFVTADALSHREDMHWVCISHWQVPAAAEGSDITGHSSEPTKTVCRKEADRM